jgi:hypothetical protein
MAREAVAAEADVVLLGVLTLVAGFAVASIRSRASATSASWSTAPAAAITTLLGA